MARPIHRYDQNRHGHLIIEESLGLSATEVYYIPPQEQVDQSNLETRIAEKHRVKILVLDNARRQVTIFPINTLGKRPDFLKPKYQKIKRITIAGATPVLHEFLAEDAEPSYSRSMTFGPTKPIENSIDEANIAEAPTSEEEILEILEGLPPAFTKDYDYGLGIAKPYLCIIDAIERMCDCDEILITKERPTGIDLQSGVFCISFDDFEVLRTSLNSSINLGQVAVSSVKMTHTYNFFADKLGKSGIPLRFGRHPLRQQMTEFIRSEGRALSAAEQDEVMSAFASNIDAISERKPDRLALLREDIEIINLKSLIDRFEEMMTAGRKEPDWQRFFQQNQFVLSMAFGYPIIVVQGQASVGGRALSGKHGKITDFLVKNSMTNNTAIIEIKTPSAKLLRASSYRGQVFPPSAELSSSIAQALDQRQRLEREFVQLRDNSKRFDIESYSVHCCVIIGRIPGNEAQLRSFELFRRNSKDVEIVTFDELLKKLKSLRDFLELREEESTEEIDDVPF